METWPYEKKLHTEVKKPLRILPEFLWFLFLDLKLNLYLLFPPHATCYLVAEVTLVWFLLHMLV